MLGLVAIGLGVTIVPETLARLPAPGVSFRPLEQRLIYEHVVIWRAKAVSRLTVAFLDGLEGSRGRQSHQAGQNRRLRAPADQRSPQHLNRSAAGMPQEGGLNKLG